MQLKTDRRLKITRHALDRASEFGFTRKQIELMFWGSVEEPKPPGARENAKYQTIYRRYNTVVMIVSVLQDKSAWDNIYLLLTVYDQRMDLKPRYL